MIISTVKNVDEANAITNGGVFNLASVFSTAILSKVIDDLKVYRSSEPYINPSQDVIIYDIGDGRYNPFPSKKDSVRENNINYSSAGLIWKDFGHEIVKSTPNPDWVWEFIDINLIMDIDSSYMSTSSTCLSNLILTFNPNWDSNETNNEAFLKAVDFAKNILNNYLNYACSLCKAEKIVEEQIEKSENSILILEKEMPWKNTLLNSENSKAQNILFAIYPDSSSKSFVFEEIPVSIDDILTSRKSIPDDWKGLTPSTLYKKTGIQDALYCPPLGKTGHSKTLEGAIDAVKKIIEL